MSTSNPLHLKGMGFIEFASPTPHELHRIFTDLGFSRTLQHKSKAIDAYLQNGICFMLNREPNSFADRFTKAHGPCVSAMGWYFENPDEALAGACQRGGRLCDSNDYGVSADTSVPSIYGIGDSALYFLPAQDLRGWLEEAGFVAHPEPTTVPQKGFYTIDHLTNNVAKGTMTHWANFYKNIFGFEEIRYFDIRGQQTGLQSYALKSPCGNFSIPINEASEEKSQINEYLEEYKGPGVQHIALKSDDLLASLDHLQGTGVQTLDIEDDYYDSIFDRVPNVREDKNDIERKNVLVDGDESGYLLQIFTKNAIGPIFFEMIQRNNHLSFGEGNFEALFKSIERDQIRRGYLDDE